MKTAICRFKKCALLLTLALSSGLALAEDTQAVNSFRYDLQELASVTRSAWGLFGTCQRLKGARQLQAFSSTAGAGFRRNLSENQLQELFSDKIKGLELAEASIETAPISFSEFYGKCAGAERKIRSQLTKVIQSYHSAVLDRPLIQNATLHVPGARAGH